MSKLFGNWYSADGFQGWKLHTTMDYISFFAIAAIAAAVVWGLIKLMSTQRNPQAAAERTCKRLKELGGGGAHCYRDVRLHTKKETMEAPIVYVARDGVYLVKVYHWGYHVNGSADGAQWVFDCGRRDVERLPNPLPRLEQDCIVLRRLFAQEKVYNVPVKPLVVFAENFTTTSFQLSGVSCAVAYQQLRSWRKAHPFEKDSKLDIKAVKRAIEGAMD